MDDIGSDLVFKSGGRDFGGSAGEDSRLSIQGAQVQSLARKLDLTGPS